MTLQEALGSARETRSLTIGAGALDRLPTVVSGHFPAQPVLLVADAASFAAAGRASAAILAAAGINALPPWIFTVQPLPAEHTYVEQLEAVLRRNEATPVAVGSGTINDLVKLASHRVGRPYLCVATAASMDGYTAFGASITYRGAKQTFSCPAPRAVVADTTIMATAPAAMTAAGYADLMAKVTAGADWILADALEIEPIDARAWELVHGGLRPALADPAGARAGKPDAIAALTEGLMLGGFAMQWSQSSRPASGAEHQFSHLWDMEHHVHNGVAPSHGFKVGVATLAISALYAWLLAQPLDRLDVAACCAAWPEAKDAEAKTRRDFANDEWVETAVAETQAKHHDRTTLKKQLTLLRERWPELRERLRSHLLSPEEMKDRLEKVGGPVTPQQIGLTLEHLRRSFARAQQIRRRFTVLDLVVRTRLLDAALAALFDPASPWSIVRP